MRKNFKIRQKATGLFYKGGSPDKYFRENGKLYSEKEVKECLISLAAARSWAEERIANGNKGTVWPKVVEALNPESFEVVQVEELVVRVESVEYFLANAS
jgi:hypothetical protein